MAKKRVNGKASDATDEGNHAVVIPCKVPTNHKHSNDKLIAMTEKIYSLIK